MEVQNQYLKSSYENMSPKRPSSGELTPDMAKEAYRPFESALAKARS